MVAWTTRTKNSTFKENQSFKTAARNNIDDIMNMKRDVRSSERTTEPPERCPSEEACH